MAVCPGWHSALVRAGDWRGAAMELSVEQLEQMEKDSYQLIDIRGEYPYQLGCIPGAVCSSAQGVKDNAQQLLKNKTTILYCLRGVLSKELADELASSSSGYQVYSLTGGYMEWLMGQMEKKQRDETFAQNVELSIQKKFHRVLFSKFAKAINQYNLVKEGDSIAVCISGGKDSMLMAKLFQELKRHNKFPFDLKFLVMDPGYSTGNRQVIENNARLLGIPVTIFENDIFESVYNVERSPCYLCARMRRGSLYSKAKELGCNKIALGHHYDDVIETILMGMLYSGQFQTMMPKLDSTNFEGMELIRPLYLIREDDIKHWRDYNSLQFIQCACRFTDTCTTCGPDGRTSSKRMEIKQLIKKLKETNPFVEGNIFKSVENVNLETIISYKQGGKEYKRYK